MPEKKIIGVSYIEYDLENEFDEMIFNNFYWLIHCAYEHKNIFQKNETNITGTSKLLKICRKFGIKFIFLSSFSAYATAASNYGKIKFACEMLCDPCTDLVIKPGLVLGRSGLFGRMTGNMRRFPFFPILDGGRQPMQTLFIGDLCEIIHSGICRNLSGVFYVAEEIATTYRQFTQEMANHLKRKIVFINVPVSLLLFVCKILDKIQIPFPINYDNILGLKHLKNIPTTTDLANFGVKVKTYKESLQLLFRP